MIGLSMLDAPNTVHTVAYVFVEKSRTDLLEKIPNNFKETRVHTGGDVKEDKQCWKTRRDRMYEFIESLDERIQPSFHVFVVDEKDGWVPVKGHDDRRHYLLGEERKKKKPRW
jgi:hypothetical protein